MGVFKDLMDWANGKTKVDNESLMSAAIELNIVIKRLKRQEKKLEKQSRIAKNKVMRFREKGDSMNAKNMARNHLQVNKQIQMVNNLQYKMQNLKFKLDQARIVTDLGGVMKNVSESLAFLKAYLNVPEMAQVLSQVDQDFMKIDIESEMITDGMEEINVDSQVEDGEIDKLLAEVDEELGIEVEETLPEVTDDKIKDLEKELDKLKSKE